jgi:hypothetical protein
MVKSNSIASQSDEMIAERYPASNYRTWNEVNKSLEARVAPFSIDLALIIFNLPMVMHVKPLRGFKGKYIFQIEFIRFELIIFDSR